MVSTRDKITNKEFMQKLKINIHFDIKDRFIDMFRRGGIYYSRKEIAYILGVSLSTFKNHLREKGFNNKGNLMRTDVKEIILELYDINLDE